MSSLPNPSPAVESLDAIARSVMDACRVIANFSESPQNITRTYLSLPMAEVHEFLRAWMKRLQMESRVDAVGNLRGLYPATTPGAARLLIGSHIDTVPDAGAFDGVLGVVIALALVEALEGQRLDYEVEVIAFSEEEGVRFGVPFIGSRALVGRIDEVLLQRKDADGNSVTQAIEAFGLHPADLPKAVIDQNTIGYLEFHIEQGPVLEDLETGIGIVEAICGQSRCDLTFRGKANHAGTTPMRLRRDALAGAAEWITLVERETTTTPGLVATVGRIQVKPGATNVIPEEAQVSLDVRHSKDAVRSEALDRLLTVADKIAAARGLTLEVAPQMDQPATAMDPKLTLSLETAAIATGSRPHRMASGAGHDAMVLATKLPTAMLFLRSPGGVSHHPDETILVKDVQAALAAGLYFLKHLNAASISSKSASEHS